MSQDEFQEAVDIVTEGKGIQAFQVKVINKCLLKK